MRDFSLKLDRVRRLVFDFDAWDHIIDRFVPKDLGKGQDPVTYVLNTLSITAREVPTLLWIGCLWEDPQLTEEQARTMLNKSIRDGTYTMMDIMMLVVNALVSQAGVQTTGPGKEQQAGELKKGPAPKLRTPGSKRKGV